jgi:hypothetical protein
MKMPKEQNQSNLINDLKFPLNSGWVWKRKKKLGEAIYFVFDFDFYLMSGKL